MILKPGQLFPPFLFPAQQGTISAPNWGSQEPRAPSPTIPSQRAFCLRRRAPQHSSCCSLLPVSWSQVSDKWGQCGGASLLCTVLMCYVCYHNKNKAHEVNFLKYVHTQFLMNVYSSIHSYQKIETSQMSISRQMDNQMWYSHTVEYYSAINRSEVLTLVTACLNFEKVMLSEKGQIQMHILYEPIHMKIKNSKSLEI